MKVKLKKLHPDAVVPKYAHNGDAGMDLTAISREFDTYGNAVYGTGISMEIPKGFVGLLFPRSSNSKKDLTLCNSVGILDSGYRGEILFKFKPTPYFNHSRQDIPSLDLTSYDFEKWKYQVGDRIGQLIILPYPQIEFQETSELSETERGESGYGSTGK